MLHVFLLAILVFSFDSFAQSSSQTQKPVVIDSSLSKLEVNQDLWFYEDKAHKASIDEIQTIDFSQKFAPSEKKAPNFGFSKSAFWSRLYLKNTSNSPMTIYLTEGYAQTDQIEFWQIAPGSDRIPYLLAGDRVKPSADRISYRLPTFKVEVPPGDSTIFIRIKTEGSLIFDIKLNSSVSFYETKVLEYALISTALGILFVMAVYNFFIWLQLRTITYLIYVVFILCMFSQPLAYTGIAVHFLTDPSWFLNEGYLIVANKTSFFGFLFPIYFLSLRGRHPWLFRLCIAGTALAFLADFGLLHSYDLGAKLGVATGSFISIMLVSCGVICSLKRYRPAYFFTLAWLLMVVANTAKMAALSGSLPTSFLSEWGVLLGTVFEVVLLSLALADKIRLNERSAFERIENLNEQLKVDHATITVLNNNLESMVEEQTREIKSILRHIQIGILVVKNPGLEITETHSQSVSHIFNSSQITGRNLVDFLYNSALVPTEQKSIVESTLMTCLGENRLAFDMNSHLLPREILYRFGTEEHVLEMDWHPVINDQDLIEKMLLSIRDITQIRSMEEEAAEKAKELDLIGEIVEISAKQFGIFVHSTQAFLDENCRLLKANHKMSLEGLKILMINLHTIKGSARALGLKHLTPLIHEAEQSLSATLNKQKPWDRDALLAENKKIQQLIDLYLNLNQVKLGRSSVDIVSFTPEFVEQMRLLLKQTEQGTQLELKVKAKPLRKAIEDVCYVRAETIFREVLSNAEMLARDLHKECPSIVIVDNSIQLSYEGQELIRNAFIHIIRNTMDHGIETSAERLKQGKPLTGLIEVRLEMNQNQIQIHYQDDGRGLNLQAIRRIALEKRLIKESDDLSLEDMAYLIFEPGFSTANSVSDISGRGVGMNAVKEYIEAKGGTSEIVLYPAAGKNIPEYVPFKFIFNLGQRLYIDRAA